MTYMDPFPRGTRVSQWEFTNPGGYNPAGGHTGRDYAVPVGTPVRAAHDGIIRNSSWLTDNYAANPWWLTRYGGDTLVLDCTDAFGNTDTMPTFVYAHLSDSTAPVGKKVKKGEIIGYSGNSGTATSGPHCHVERLNPNFDLHNNVYGRSALDFDEYFLASNGIDPQSAITKEEEMPLTDADITKLFDTKVPRQGGMKGDTSLKGMIGYNDSNLGRIINLVTAQDATIKGLAGAVKALAGGEQFDEAKLLSSIAETVRAAAADGVKDGIDGIDTTVTLKAGS